MKKYSVRIISTEEAIAEVFANSNDEAISKAAHIDCDELDWCAGPFSYEVEGEEDVCLDEKYLRSGIESVIRSTGFSLKEDGGNSYLKTDVVGEELLIPIRMSGENLELIEEIERISDQYNPRLECMQHLVKLYHEKGGEYASNRMVAMQDAYQRVRWNLLDLVDGVTKYRKEMAMGED